MLFYLVPATVVCGFCLQSLSQDQDASIRDAKNWAFMLVAATLWPITLPSILLKKARQKSANPRLGSVNC